MNHFNKCNPQIHNKVIAGIYSAYFKSYALANNFNQKHKKLDKFRSLLLLQDISDIMPEIWQYCHGIYKNGSLSFQNLRI